MRRAIFLLLVCIPPSLATAADEPRSVVLVMASACDIEELSTLDVRKVYLGIRVSRNGHVVRPLRLQNDDFLERVFFQYIVAMTEKTYERRLLSLTMNHGTPAPRRFESPDELATAMRDGECGLGYMWRSDAARFDDLRTIKLVWQGD